MGERVDHRLLAEDTHVHPHTHGHTQSELGQILPLHHHIGRDGLFIYVINIPAYQHC